MAKKDETIITMYIGIGERLKERRKQLCFTQEELAEKIGVSPQMISSAERGQKGMMPENVIHISEVLGVSTDYLLCGKTGSVDTSIILQKITKLESDQLMHLETIINSFVDAVSKTEE